MKPLHQVLIEIDDPQSQQDGALIELRVAARTISAQPRVVAAHALEHAALQDLETLQAVGAETIHARRTVPTSSLPRLNLAKSPGASVAPSCGVHVLVQKDVGIAEQQPLAARCGRTGIAGFPVREVILVLHPHDPNRRESSPRRSPRRPAGRRSRRQSLRRCPAHHVRQGLLEMIKPPLAGRDDAELRSAAHAATNSQWRTMKAASAASHGLGLHLP